MSLMKMTAGFEGKVDVAFTQPLAASVAVSDGEIALWVGETIAGQPNVQQSVFAVVNDLLERLREIGTPTAASTGRVLEANASAVVQMPRKPDIVVSPDALFAVPADTDVRLYVGYLFQPLPGTSVSTAVKRLLEVWLEKIGKQAAA